MAEHEKTGSEVVPGRTHEVGSRPNLPPGLPPHPLDAEWHLQMEGETYGPYTGHQVKEFVQDGRVTRETDVIRVGSSAWLLASDDPALSKLFHDSSPAPRTESRAPDGRISAGEGATVVQVMNNMAPERQPTIVIDGAAKQKSPGVALVLSLLIVGLGQVYNGEVGKGALMFFGCILLWFVLLGWVVMIWSWIDAYQTANSMNERYRQKLAAGLA